MGRPEALEELYRIDKDLRLLTQAVAALQWDQETYMPPEAVEGRADQLALLEGLTHDRAVDPRIGSLLERVGSTPENPRGDEALPSLDRDFLRVFRRNYDKAVRLPGQLVRDAARAEGLSQAAWAEARRNNDFPSFAPHLDAMVSFAKKKAEFWGFADHPYDGLLDQHEPGVRQETIASLFDPLGKRLSELVRRISAAPAPDTSFLCAEYPVEDQDRFGRQLMADLGYELSRGRLDLSAHPFTTTLGADDVRITTRYFRDNMTSGLFSIIHETGHALYELGFGPDIRGTCLADGSSMGIHESQSRLWENVVGRSRAFWRGRFPALRKQFPDRLGSVDEGAFYRAVNAVRPSLIRVDADEVTYSLHVILRFDLERRLFDGSLGVEGLPAAWNRGMAEYLGVVPDTDADGVLQDIHWSMGAFGYFPSYALGNLYGLQFWRVLLREIPDAESRLAEGRFDAVLAWLRERIHRHGCRMLPEELLQSVCGETLSILPFVEYLESKYELLYGL